MDSSPLQSGDLSLNEFQYPAPSSNMFSLGSPLYSTPLGNICPESLQYSLNSSQNSTKDIHSQEASLFSPNSVNLDDFNSIEPLYYSPNSVESSAEDINSPDALSPLNYNIFQDLNVSPTSSVLADFDNHSSSMDDTFNTYDTLLPPEFNLNSPKNQYENNRKRASVICDSNSSDEFSKKKRKSTNETDKFVKKSKPTKKINSSINHKNSDDSLTSKMRLKSSSIDVDTIKKILASLFETTNQSAESSDTNSVQDHHSEDEEGMSCDENTSSGTKLPTSPESPNSTSQPQPNSKKLTNKQQKKVAHNVIERRYRNNINDRINDLKNVVPALCHLKSKDDDVIEEVDGIPAATKTNKATILTKATEYILYLKKNNERIKNENTILKKIIETVPGGAELYYSLNKNDDKLTPPDTPPPSEVETPYQNKSPSGNSGSRVLLALFMCMNFFTDPSKYAQSTVSHHHHHDEGRVIASNDSLHTTESAITNEIYNSIVTIDIWYLARVFTFLTCFTYIVWPSLLSFKSHRSRKSAIQSCLETKAKDVTELYSSFSSLTNTSSMNTLGYVAGLFIESLRLFLRKVLGWEISFGYTDVDMDERVLEVELWNRLGEAELCGVLYTCLRTINLLESPYTYNKSMRISPSRIYANAALQCHVVLRSVPFLSRRIVPYFWKLAIKEKACSNCREKWLEVALINDNNNDILKSVANRISDHIFHLSKKEETFKPMINTTVPLVYVSEVQALFHIKEAFSNLISERHDVNKVQKKKSKFTFHELFGITTPASPMHWYALVGCIIQAFYEGKNDLGVKLLNKLKEESKNNNKDDLDKQIITMGLLSRSLLICGKLEASIHYADKVVNYVTLRKNKEMETTEDDKDFFVREIVKDIDNLAEFCVGWIVLETRIVILGIVGNVLSKNKDKALPNVLGEKYMKSSIDIWARYLRRSSKFDVFDSIPKLRSSFIRKLDDVGRIIAGIDEIDSGCDCDDYDKQNNSEYNATRALRVLKGM
ncbi:16476_t:CDS:2 [Dentiscutata heterogama]|uniref:16476_t:CDS:1 n=1 Tax=Dentiscutata heterogama TaxID=1316150 RepID=A0ACA9JV87_9GLOM|nr:16476_t:CDS:2 [Dentiscutata heterogama]